MLTSLLCAACLLSTTDAWTGTFTLGKTNACGGEVGTFVQTVDQSHGGDVVTVDQQFTFGSLSDGHSNAGTTESVTMGVVLSCDSTEATDTINMSADSCTPTDIFSMVQCATLIDTTIKITLENWANIGKGICVPVTVTPFYELTGFTSPETYYIKGTAGENGYKNPCKEKSAGSTHSLGLTCAVLALIAAAVL